LMYFFFADNLTDCLSSAVLADVHSFICNRKQRYALPLHPVFNS